MAVRREHLIGITRRLSANERIMRLSVLDQMIELIDEYVGVEATTKVINLYESWVFDQGGNYDAFEKLFKDIISEAEEAEELPQMVKYRFSVYLDYLFPGPLPA